MSAASVGWSAGRRRVGGRGASARGPRPRPRRRDQGGDVETVIDHVARCEKAAVAVVEGQGRADRRGDDRRAVVEHPVALGQGRRRRPGLAGERGA